MKTCRSGEFDNLQFSCAGVDVKLSELSGLSIDVCYQAYTSTTIRAEINGHWESEFEQILREKTAAIAPLYIEIEPKAVFRTNEQLLSAGEGSLNQDAEVCFFASFEVNDPDENLDLVLFSSDPYGNTRWIYPISDERTSDRKRLFLFLVPRPSEVVTGQREQAFGNPNKHLLRLIGWRVEFSEAEFAQKVIRRKNHKLYQVSRKSKGNWIFSPFPRMRSDGWKESWKAFDRKKGKSLLLIHGTNGTASHAFTDLIRDAETMEALYNEYGNRIIAFNHPTVGKGVAKNVTHLLKYFNNARHIAPTFDILTRSRGALVARHLLEKQLVPDHVRIGKENKLVMLAGPNQGTPSSQPENWVYTLQVNSWLNRLTESNRLTLNENDRADILYEISYIKGKLRMKKSEFFGIRLFAGIMDQTPNSDFLRKLNDPANPVIPSDLLPRYYLIGASFNPQDHDVQLGMTRRKQLRKTLNKVFGSEVNDGIVPLRSALMQHPDFDRSPNFFLPHERIKIVEQSPNTHHNNYPTDRSIRKAIKDFLLAD